MAEIEAAAEAHGFSAVFFQAAEEAIPELAEAEVILGQSAALVKHAPKLRYLTTDSGIAAVSGSGRITARGTGMCYIYVFAHNGVSKRIQVTVK